MQYTKIIVAALLALFVASDASAQVSVRRQRRDRSETPARVAEKKTQPVETKREEPVITKQETPVEVKQEKAVEAQQETPVVVKQETPAVVKREAPVVAKKGASKPKQASPRAEGKTLRQRNFEQYQMQAAGEPRWQHTLYRELDMNVEANASLYYPVEPAEGLTNLFRVILSAFVKGELPAYEYLADREAFTEKYLAKPREVLDKFEVPYRVQAAKVRNANDVLLIDDIDIPSAEVMSYYVKERWEMDEKTGSYRPRVLAVCPVLHRASEAGEGSVRYPMFWVKFEDLRPLLRQHLVITAGMNHAPRYTMEEYFQLHKYEGEIYKEQNLRGLTLQQQFGGDAEAVKQRQQAIDSLLSGFRKHIWRDPAQEEEEALSVLEKAVVADSLSQPEKSKRRCSRREK